jgi:hypothetical protein
MTPALEMVALQPEAGEAVPAILRRIPPEQYPTVTARVEMEIHLALTGFDVLARPIRQAREPGLSARRLTQLLHAIREQQDTAP